MVSTLSAEMLRAFEHLPDLYLVLSPELVVLTASNAYLEHTFLKREDLLNQPVLEYFGGLVRTTGSETIASLETSLHRVLKTRKADKMPYQRYDLVLENGIQT